MPQIEGFVEEIVFRNDLNGWTVLSIKSGRERISAVGVVAAISVGENVAVTGDWVEHPDYGRQIKIAELRNLQPKTTGGIERYLGSGVIRGIGPATAKLIVHHFGKRALEILDDTPERLTEIEGIGAKRAKMIAESYFEQREMRRTMLFLQNYQLTPAMSMKVYQAFGDRAQEVLKADPYLLVDKVPGIGFKTADGIALNMGIARESEHRLRCGVMYSLNEAVVSAGHMFLPYGELVESARRVLLVDPSLIERAIDQMVLSGEVLIRDQEGQEVVYLPLYYEAEGDVARRMMALMRSVEALDDARAVREIAAYESRERVTLSEKQKEAVKRAAYGGVTIVTGGPGTGKTTSIHCILHLMRSGFEIALCAPTGRAAKRMSETTGYEAKTIHRLLEYAGEEDAFLKDEDDPLKADVVIVDEMSMVDIHLMRALLRALKPGTRLVMVGDADQLPSVGAGNVLKDIISSDVVPVVKLDRIFRQGSESMIVENAHRINRGEMPLLNGKGTDFFLERRDLAAVVRESVVQLVKARLPGYRGFDSLKDIQVMSPMKKGDTGVYQLNRALQLALNPASDKKGEITRGEWTFRQGDKVMQTRNNYKLEWTRKDEEGEGVYNGDIGFITAIDPEERALTVLFDDDREAEYKEADLEDLDLAYCMSVHKSQGSEFPCVVMPVLNGPPMLYTRNLFYTAVTRAKRLVVLVGRESCIEQMVSNDHIAKRYSALAERIRKFAETA